MLRSVTTALILSVCITGYSQQPTYLDYEAPKISAVAADSITISLSVTNTGDRDGAEMVQVYASAPKTEGVERENKKLVGFAKVDAGAGESSNVSINIPKSTLAYYDENTRSMIVAPGKYRFHVGNSSASLPHNVTLDLKP